uniref:Histone-lysine N-methyltransferase CG1716 n=1 Tax=Rhabditophanes sp. KR3021 TaxID=114890 RepID=A0AC35U866_9BILA
MVKNKNSRYSFRERTRTTEAISIRATSDPNQRITRSNSKLTPELLFANSVKQKAEILATSHTESSDNRKRSHSTSKIKRSSVSSNYPSPSRKDSSIKVVNEKTQLEDNNKVVSDFNELPVPKEIKPIAGKSREIVSKSCGSSSGRRMNKRKHNPDEEVKSKKVADVLVKRTKIDVVTKEVKSEATTDVLVKGTRRSAVAEEIKPRVTTHGLKKKANYAIALQDTVAEDTTPSKAFGSKETIVNVMTVADASFEETTGTAVTTVEEPTLVDGNPAKESTLVDKTSGKEEIPVGDDTTATDATSVYDTPVENDTLVDETPAKENTLVDDTTAKEATPTKEVTYVDDIPVKEGTHIYESCAKKPTPVNDTIFDKDITCKEIIFDKDVIIENIISSTDDVEQDWLDTQIQSENLTNMQSADNNNVPGLETQKNQRPCVSPPLVKSTTHSRNDTPLAYTTPAITNNGLGIQTNIAIEVDKITDTMSDMSLECKKTSDKAQISLVNRSLESEQTINAPHLSSVGTSLGSEERINIFQRSSVSSLINSCQESPDILCIKKEYKSKTLRPFDKPKSGDYWNIGNHSINPFAIEKNRSSNSKLMAIKQEMGKFDLFDVNELLFILGNGSALRNSINNTQVTKLSPIPETVVNQIPDSTYNDNTEVNEISDSTNLVHSDTPGNSPSSADRTCRNNMFLLKEPVKTLLVSRIKGKSLGYSIKQALLKQSIEDPGSKFEIRWNDTPIDSGLLIESLSTPNSHVDTKLVGLTEMPRSVKNSSEPGAPSIPKSIKKTPKKVSNSNTPQKANIKEAQLTERAIQAQRQKDETILRKFLTDENKVVDTKGPKCLPQYRADASASKVELSAGKMDLSKSKENLSKSEEDLSTSTVDLPEAEELFPSPRRLRRPWASAASKEVQTPIKKVTVPNPKETSHKQTADQTSKKVSSQCIAGPSKPEVTPLQTYPVKLQRREPLVQLMRPEEPEEIPFKVRYGSLVFLPGPFAPDPIFPKIIFPKVEKQPSIYMEPMHINHKIKRFMHGRLNKSFFEKEKPLFDFGDFDVKDYRKGGRNSVPRGIFLRAFGDMVEREKIVIDNFCDTFDLPKINEIDESGPFHSMTIGDKVRLIYEELVTNFEVVKSLFPNTTGQSQFKLERAITRYHRECYKTVSQLFHNLEYMANCIPKEDEYDNGFYGDGHVNGILDRSTRGTSNFIVYIRNQTVTALRKVYDYTHYKDGTWKVMVQFRFCENCQIISFKDLYFNNERKLVCVLCLFYQCVHDEKRPMAACNAFNYAQYEVLGSVDPSSSK